MLKFSGYKPKRPFMRHQYEDFVKTKDQPYWAYLHDMGTGKTKIILDKAQYLYQKGEIQALIIIAPNDVHHDHAVVEVPQEIYEPCISAYYRATMKKGEAKAFSRLFESGGELRIVAFNTDAIRTKKGFDYMYRILTKYPTFFAVDEATDFANPESQRTKALLELGRFAKYKAILDGTPVNQGPLDLWAPCQFLKPGLLGHATYTTFRNRHAQLGNNTVNRELDIILCVTRKRYTPGADLSKYSGSDQLSALEEKQLVKTLYAKYLESNRLSVDQIARILPDRLRDKARYIKSIFGRNAPYVLKNADGSSAYKNLDELQAKLKSFSSRVMLEDCVDMPELVEKNHYYSLDARYSELYSKLKDELVIEFEESGDMMSVQHALVLIGRLQLLLAGYYKDDTDTDTFREIPGKNQRIEELFGLLGKIDLSRHRVIIAAQYVEVIKRLERELAARYGKGSTVTYYAGTKDKIESKSRFKNDKTCRFMVLNPASGSLGLNLVSATYMIHFDRLFSLRKNLQVIKRFFRKGQTRNCVSIDMIAKGTIDEKRLDALRKKKSVSDYITEDFKRLLL